MRPLHLPGALIGLALGACAHVQPSLVPVPGPLFVPANDQSQANESRMNLPRVAVLDTPAVIQQAVPMGRDTGSAVRDAALPPDSERAVVPLPELPTWDIDVHSYETKAQVAYYLTRFAGPERVYLQARLSDGSRFEPMIREALRRGGIPEDLCYLALVESGFDPNAYSRAAAVGMWQFMPSTARDMGLRVDGWVDERRDPVRSTNAAVEFIRSLRDQFGSIYLAAAAYNGGPGRISRGLTRYADDLFGTAGDDLFFALADKKYLKNETREYVPQLIAVALIAKDPQRYGISIERRAAFDYDSVTVPSLTSLAVIARAAGIAVADLKELNPQILHGMTPPRTKTLVRIPRGSAGEFDSVFALVPDSIRAGARIVHTKGGETPEKLAKLTNVQPRRIAEFNPLLKRNKSGTYRADQTVYVPKVEAVRAMTSVPGKPPR